MVMVRSCGMINGQYGSYEVCFSGLQSRFKFATLIMIALTSGTTGEPKATVHFHRDVMAVCRCFPEHVLKPTAYRAMLGAYDVSSLRKCVSSGEALPSVTRDAWRQCTGICPIDEIGPTEMLHVFASTHNGPSKEGAIGKAVPVHRLAILDDHGRCLSPYQVGNLAVLGPTGCRYLNDSRQRRYVKHGRNLTGDAAYLDNEGCLFYQARADEMIISSGYTISPAEVEQALLHYPDVVEFCVVGQPDELGWTLICAHIALRSGVDESEALTARLLRHVKRLIAPYKCSRRIACHIGNLPRNESGKIRRAALRQSHSNARPTD